MDGTPKLRGLQIDILTPKLMIFEAGRKYFCIVLLITSLDEILKEVRIRINIREKMDEEKYTFKIAVKAPSGAVLDSNNNEAHLVINSKFFS